MTKSDVMKEFLKKTVIPVVVALCLFSMFSRIFVENGAPDYFLIWLACGVPFGIGKMFTLIPIGFGISGTVGVVALNLVLGGLIGGVILIWKLAVAIWYLPPECRSFYESVREAMCIMGKNAGKTSAVMQNEDMSMFNAYERENIRRTKAVLDRIEHELRLDRTTAYQVALHEVMAMDKERQTLDAITDCLEKLLPSNFCKDIK